MLTMNQQRQVMLELDIPVERQLPGKCVNLKKEAKIYTLLHSSDLRNFSMQKVD
jgi:hypothetical protein